MRRAGKLRAALAAAALLLLWTAVPAAADTAEPVRPPPVRIDPPDGDPPGPAANLLPPADCTPPVADAAAPQGSPPRERLQLTEAHRIATGAGQLIAVIDTGIAPHPRLGSRLAGGGDYLTGGDGLADCDGHGTAVAGLLAAQPADGDEVIGVAPGAELLAIRQSSLRFSVQGPDGSSRPAGDVDTLAEAVVLATRAGADVVNISEAVCLPPRQAAVEGALLRAALRYAADADVVVVAAAGNTGVGFCEESADQVSLPGWYDELVAVGAVGPDDAPADFTVPGPWVDVAAPGVGLRSLAVGGGVTGEGVAGTSFAAPWVAGLAALVRERFPDLSAAQVVDRILVTARRPAGGRDDLVGFGVIDPIAALTAEPAVLPSSDADDAVPAVTLPGTTAVAAPPTDGPPLDLAAVLALLAAASAAAVLIRRGPRTDTAGHGTRPSG